MKVAIIQVRDRNTRLPGKGTLQFSDGVTVIEQVVKRTKQIENVDQVAIAMPQAEIFHRLGIICRELEKKYGLYIHYGHDTDLFHRYYNTAQSMVSHGAPPMQMLRVTADDPFRDSNLARKVMQRLCGGADYAYTFDYPEGVNAEGFSYEFLAYAVKHAKEREHLTNYFLKEHAFLFDKKYFAYDATNCPHNWSGYRATLDTPADWEVIQRLYPFKGLNNSAAGIVGFLEKEVQQKCQG